MCHRIQAFLSPSIFFNQKHFSKCPHVLEGELFGGSLVLEWSDGIRPLKQERKKKKKKGECQVCLISSTLTSTSWAVKERSLFGSKNLSLGVKIASDSPIMTFP